MSRTIPVFIVGFWALLAILPNQSSPQATKALAAGKTLIEFAKPLAREPGGRLATVEYAPSDSEAPFFRRLSSEEQTTGNFVSDYDITGKKKIYVGWFGIIRKTLEDSITNQSILLIEMKYQDGLSDSHIMVVSINGAGDFQALVPGVHLGVTNLSLVKVYGVVTDEKDSTPQVSAEFIRVWDWGLFTFMAYGDQKGNSVWKKLNKIDDNHIYKAFPNMQYYEDRLGHREDK